MKNKTSLMLFGLVALLLVIVLAARVLAAGEAIPRFLLSSGGATNATSTSGNVTLSGSLGQPVTGRVSNTSYGLCSGFWCGPLGPSTLFLPLVARNYVAPIILGDAPDTCEQAYPIELFPYQYIDDFWKEKEYDWYSFTATQGISYTIQTSNVAAGTRTSLALYQMNQCSGNYIQAPYKPGSNSEVLLAWQAPENGKYNIVVYESLGFIGGNYTLYIQENP